MIGAGIFINTIPFIKIAGPLSAIIYLAVGILMMPLIFSIMELLKKFPGGNFYTYAHDSLGRFLAFFSTWSYFTAKLASSTLMIHFSVKLVQSVLPILSSIHTFLLDCIIIGLFTYLNTANMKTGSKIQVAFMAFKLSTVLFVILASLYTIFGGPITIGTIDLTTIPLAIPQAIYVFAGFEAACSISRHIENPEKNGPRAVLISFFTALIIYIVYQFLFYQVISGQDLTAATYTEGLPIFFSNLTFCRTYIGSLVAIFQLAIASSALGGAYGILFSNNWNLYMLAEKNVLLFSSSFKRLNKHAMPYICLATEFVLSIIYLLMSNGNNVFLQQVNSFGCTITYLISTIALYIVMRNKTLPLLGIASSLLLLGFCINAFLQTNYFALLVFSAILAVGSIGYVAHNKKQSAT